MKQVLIEVDVPDENVPLLHRKRTTLVCQCNLFETILGSVIGAAQGAVILGVLLSLLSVAIGKNPSPHAEYGAILGSIVGALVAGYAVGSGGAYRRIFAFGVYFAIIGATLVGSSNDTWNTVPYLYLAILSYTILGAITGWLFELYFEGNTRRCHNMMWHICSGAIMFGVIAYFIGTISITTNALVVIIGIAMGACCGYYHCKYIDPKWSD
jgi:hypothetical protein